MRSALLKAQYYGMTDKEKYFCYKYTIIIITWVKVFISFVSPTINFNIEPFVYL